MPAPSPWPGIFRRGHQLKRGNVEGYAWLLRVLADMDGRTPRARRRTRVALELIAANERLMDGLFVHCRRNEVSVAVFADRLGRFGTGKHAPVLASLHPDGQVREAAVKAMALRLRPAYVPFLVERAVDWVPEVRTAAHDVLRAQLGQRPELVSPARSATSGSPGASMPQRSPS